MNENPREELENALHDIEVLRLLSQSTRMDRDMDLSPDERLLLDTMRRHGQTLLQCRSAVESWEFPDTWADLSAHDLISVNLVLHDASLMISGLQLDLAVAEQLARHAAVH